MSIFSKKKQNRFIELLIKQAELSFEGMQTLLEYVRLPDPALAQQVSDMEGQADEVRRILIDELNRTFVTPLDREDIFALSLAIDDILDYAYTTVEEMSLLGIQPNPFIERMVSLLTDAAREIHNGVQRLEDHPNVANDHAVRAKALENRMEFGLPRSGGGPVRRPAGHRPSGRDAQVARDLPPPVERGRPRRRGGECDRGHRRQEDVSRR